VSKRVAILQSNYIPWKGYFDIINSVDEFILFDDMQYTRRDWRNRNLIKTRDGTKWLTIPVEAKGRFHQTIEETRISDPAWASAHWKTLTHSYAKAPHFDEYAPALEPLYLDSAEEYLSKVNHAFLLAICGFLGITTTISWSSEYEAAEGKTERLVSLCEQTGATTYLSGPAARGYIEPHLFEAAGIALEWVDYEGYPEYPQLYPPFDHHVSVLDLLFSAGGEAPAYMKSFGS
jgi:hypothetical protein